MKTQLTNHLIKTSLLSLLGIHLGIHILYLAPVNPATELYSQPVQTYMSTFFTQNWHLFAPEPATSGLNLEYRCSADGAWQNPLKDLSTKHKALPITARGKQMYVYQNIARQIFNGRLLHAQDKDVPEIDILKGFIQNQCGTRSQAEVRILRTYTQDYSQRLEKAQGRVESVNINLNNGHIAWN